MSRSSLVRQAAAWWGPTIVVAALGYGCSQYSTTVGDAGIADSSVGDSLGVGGDAGTLSDAPDAPDAMSRTDAGSRCPLPSILANGDFEQGAGQWKGGQIVFAPHNGVRALRICGGDLDAGPPLAIATSGLPEAGASRFSSRVWVRRETKVAPPTKRIVGILYDPANTPNYAFDNTADTGQEWVCVDGQTAASLTAKLMGIIVQASGGTCADIDDVEVFEVPAAGTLPLECLCPPP
jgi:hypothetical protein